MTEIENYKMKHLVLYFEQVYIQMQISMVKVNVVMACKILKSLNVVVHANLIIQRELCNQIKIPKT